MWDESLDDLFVSMISERIREFDEIGYTKSKRRLRFIDICYDSPLSDYDVYRFEISYGDISKEHMCINVPHSYIIDERFYCLRNKLLAKGFDIEEIYKCLEEAFNTCVPKWTNTPKVEPIGVEVTYTDLANAGMSTNQFLDSISKLCKSIKDETEEEEKEPEQDPEPEHTILVYQSEPIGKDGIVLILEGTNPEYEEWVEKQLEKGE